jgi:hypothetical protein
MNNLKRRRQHASLGQRQRADDRRERMRSLPADYQRAMERTFAECGLGGDLSLRGQRHD